jgi:hypothetical protein
MMCVLVHTSGPIRACKETACVIFRVHSVGCRFIYPRIFDLLDSGRLHSARYRCSGHRVAACLATRAQILVKPQLLIHPAEARGVVAQIEERSVDPLNLKQGIPHFGGRGGLLHRENCGVPVGDVAQSLVSHSQGIEPERGKCKIFQGIRVANGRIRTIRESRESIFGHKS